jgi:outer membrane lipase/esterase
MSLRFRPARSLLAAALALSAAPAFAGDNVFSNTWFFGDSLTDSGFYEPFLVSSFGPNAALADKFTTNPGLVWSEFVANYYGGDGSPAWQLALVNGVPTLVPAGGGNYAAGGATIVPGPGYPPTPPTQFAPSLTDQVNAYLAANGGAADPDALYAVWGGANDLFFNLGGATTQDQFLGAATAQAQLVGTLEAAGARYVMVPTMPDVGVTPFGLSQGPAGSAGITQLVQGYNATLFGSLEAAGLRVIPLDTYDFLHEIIADPSAYGLVNVTMPACGALPSLGCVPVDPSTALTWAFADGVHPTTGAHQMLAEYAISMIEGPRQIAALPVSADAVGRARAETVFGHATAMQGDGMRWWGNARGDFQHSNSEHNAYGGGGPAVTGGVDWRSGALAYGVFGGIGQQKIDWGHDSGDFRQTDTTLGGYIGWNGAHGWVTGQVSYTNLDYDTHRDILIGTATRTHDGSPGGSNVAAGVQAGWTFGDGAFRSGPVLGLLSQTIRVDGFDESEPTLSTSLSYPDQKFDSLIGSVGWQASYAINDRVQPYARVAWNRQFEDAPEEAFARSQALGTTGDYAVPGLSQDKDYATLLAGARIHVAGFDADFGVTGTVGQDSADDASAFVTIGRGF